MTKKLRNKARKRLKTPVRLKLESAPVILCDNRTDAQGEAFRLRQWMERSAKWAEEISRILVRAIEKEIQKKQEAVVGQEKERPEEWI